MTIRNINISSSAAIATSKIAEDGGITSSHLASSAVATANIAASAVTSTKLGDLAVETAKIAASAVTSTKLGDLAVETAKIAASAVTSTKLADNAVENAKIGSTAVSADKIGSSAILDRHLSSKLRIGFIPLDLSQWRILSSTGGEVYANGSVSAGGRMSEATAPTYGAISTTTYLQRVTWSSASAVQILSPTVPLPPDFSTQSSAKFKCFAGLLEASTDAGALINLTAITSTGSSGGTGFFSTNVRVSSASTVASTHSFALTDSSILAKYPDNMTFRLGITSTSDKIAVYSAWVEYARTSTA